MSTTVTYKGSALTTVNKDTKTLKTAGKYMEGDVVVIDNGPSLIAKTATPTESEQIIVADNVLVDEKNQSGIAKSSSVSIMISSLSILESGKTYHVVGSANAQKYGSPDTYTTITFDTNWTYGTNLSYEATVTSTITTIVLNNSYIAFQFSSAGENGVTDLNLRISEKNYDGLSQVTINAIPSTYIQPTGTYSITTNGTYNIASYASAEVNVSGGATVNNQDKTITPTTSQQSISADSGYTGLGIVTVNAIPSQYIIPSGNLAITSNGTGIDVTQYASVSVDVPVGSTTNNQDKTVTPTESQQIITADSGYTGLGTVTVNAISSTYVGSEITQRDGDDLTVSGATISVPAGYYSAAASKSVASGIATAPTSISGTAANISTGSETLTLTKTVSITPTVSTGYITSGTAGNSSVSLTANVAVNPTLTVSGPTVTAPAGYYTESASKSVTTMTPPSEPSNNYTSGYTRLKVIDRATTTRYINIPPGYNSTGVYYQISAVANGSATTPATAITANPTITISDSGLITATASASRSVTPTVSAGYVSSGTAGTITVSGSKTQQLTTKAAATITPTTTNQTIASGTYLTGTQIILGDPDLVGPNIVAGASIFNINGTATFQHYYTGSSAPASSLGENGDIYLQA